ncbi:MAG: hypothetical protein DRN66_01490 [Candidatus Nanohalarchaeota archaeon]|nr:MAG: hypothetical protein DRN66_01490 [Candidatus Nanohaloarchaeota archaeon]
MAENKCKTMTRIVKELAQILECSESALWNNVNSLKRSKLIENNREKPVKLTYVGILIINPNFRGDLDGK